MKNICSHMRVCARIVDDVVTLCASGKRNRERLMR